MKKIYFTLCLLIIIGFAPDCIAETVESVSDKSVPASTTSLVPSSDNPTPIIPADTKNNFHLEIGGNCNWLDNDYGQWKGLNLSLNYSGFKGITPSLSIARLSRKEGSQFIYGFGSYIDITSKSYMTLGISGAPVKDPNVIIYPRLRLDLGYYFSTPLVDGLVFSTGITHYPKQNGGGGDSISIGGIYYWKIILQGSLSYNIARPGNITSLSQQAGFMVGAQGKYWFGGGATGGREAYQMPKTNPPFQVRFRGYGAYLFYNKWIGKDWGINTRLDVGQKVDAYKLVGITASLFMDF